MNAIPAQTGILPFRVLVWLEERSGRARSVTELALIMVNETQRLLRYGQAALWLEDGGVRALSGVSDVDPSSPFTLWLDRVFRQMDPPGDAPLVAGAGALKAADRDAWDGYLPPHAIWVALAAPDGTRYGTLMFARDDRWEAIETILLKQLAENYGLAWARLSWPRPFAVWQRLRPMRLWTFAAAAVLAGL